MTAIRLAVGARNASPALLPDRSVRTSVADAATISRIPSQSRATACSMKRGKIAGGGAVDFGRTRRRSIANPPMDALSRAAVQRFEARPRAAPPHVALPTPQASTPRTRRRRRGRPGSSRPGALQAAQCPQTPRPADRASPATLGSTSRNRERARPNHSKHPRRAAESSPTTIGSMPRIPRRGAPPRRRPRCTSPAPCGDRRGSRCSGRARSRQPRRRRSRSKARARSDPADLVATFGTWMAVCDQTLARTPGIGPTRRPPGRIRTSGRA